VSTGVCVCKVSLLSAAYQESLRDFWTLRKLITTTTTRTTRVAFWDAPSGSKKCTNQRINEPVRPRVTFCRRRRSFYGPTVRPLAGIGKVDPWSSKKSLCGVDYIWWMRILRCFMIVTAYLLIRRKNWDASDQWDPLELGQMQTRAGNGSLELTHDPLTHLICDPWPISYDAWPIIFNVENM